MKRSLKFIGVLSGLAILAVIAILVLIAWINRRSSTELSPSPSITPTPEVFNPLDPSPTASKSDLPLTCQVTDLSVLIEQDRGYCFAYPPRFGFDTQPLFNMPAVIGPNVGTGPDPVSATFAIEVMPYDPNQGLDQQIDGFLESFTEADPRSMVRARLTVGGETAVLVENVPVQLSWRLVFVPHNGQIYRLMYWPVDVPEAQADVEELYQTTIGSFAFLPTP